VARNKSEKELSNEKLYEEFSESFDSVLQEVYKAMLDKLKGDWFTPLGIKEAAGGTQQV